MIDDKRAAFDHRHGVDEAHIAFALDADGHPRQARMEAASELTDFSFDFHDLRLEPVR